MRLLLLLVLCLLLSSCNNSGTSHRPSYVISQYSETADVEPVTESLAE